MGIIADSGSPAVRRAARLLREIAAHNEPSTITDLSRRVGEPKSSVTDLCGALVNAGMLERVDGGRYALGFASGELARGLVDGSGLLEAFAPVCDSEADWRGHAVVLTVRIGSEAVHAAVRPGDRPLPVTMRAGMRQPLWATAGGRALLGQFDPITALRLCQPAEALDTTPEELCNEVRAGHRAGITTYDEPVGLKASAALVRHRSRVIATVAVIHDSRSAPAATPEDQIALAIASRLTDATNERDILA